MRPSRLTATAITALSVLATTAFAPASQDASAAALHVTLVTDEDPGTDQPVVLLVGADVDAVSTAYAQQLVADRFAFAGVTPGCGDLGGPQDVAALTSALDQLSTADGSNGRVAVRGDGPVAGLQALAVAAADQRVLAVVTDDAITNPYDVLRSAGGVARSATLEAPTLPCPHGGATDGTRDAYWDARDMTDGRSVAASFTATADDGLVPVRQAIALTEALVAADDSPVLHLFAARAAAEDGPPQEEIEDFLERMLIPAQLHMIRSSSFTFLSYGPCLVGVCPSNSATFSSTGVPTPRATRTSLFLNRTFEQDFDCVPVCVPGPGTGEEGSLEFTNRFTDPWSPVFTWADAGIDSERATIGDPLNRGEGLGGEEQLPGGHGYHSLAYLTPEIAEWTGLHGTVELEGQFSTGSAGGTITPVLVAVQQGALPGTDSVRVLSRGALDLDFAAGLGARAHTAGWKSGTIRFDAVSTSLAPGDRLMIVLQSGNVEHFAPGSAQGTVNVANGPVEGVTATGSILHLPLTDELVFAEG